MANSSNLQWRTRNAALALAITAVLAACSGSNNRNNNAMQTPAVGDTLAVTTASRLINFSRSTGGIQSSVNITGLTAGDVLVGFDIRPANNTLVAIANTGRIYSIDPSSGVATVLSVITPALALAAFTSGTSFGVDFNPVPDRLRITTNNGRNLRVNVATGVTTIDGDLTLNGTAAMNVVGASYNNNFGGACRTQLFYLDVANNRLLTTTAPNDGILTVVGALGVTTNSNRTGFEFFTAANGTSTASVVLTVGGIPTVFSLNPGTGAATAGAAITGLSPGENIVGIAATTPGTVTQTAGELTGLTSGNAIFTFNSAAPNKICSGPTNVTGLTMGENVVGIDVRPANQALYGVGLNAGVGRVFQIDRMTGAISAPQTITAAGSGLTIAGMDFGVDFNPVPDRLRVTSNTGENLRINVVDGTTTVDTAVVAGPAITADAYTNSFGPAAPATTNLYTIDSATASLNVQNPPNNGVQVRVAALTVPAPVVTDPAVPIGTITGVGGFDINGLNNTALAALTVGATATATQLFTINLATGLSTPAGAIAAGTGTTPLIAGTIRGIALNAVPQATILGVTTDNQLVSFTEAATGTLATNVAITGLAAGENVIGIDVRPANGLIYAATSQGATYIINQMTGAATGRVAFAPAPAAPPAMPAADPFTMIMGTNFGVDFNPVPDRLRLVSDGLMGNNLRINVATGATLTDTNLAAGVTATAAGYLNSVPGAVLATTLYTIDTASDRLNMQVPPNDGVQVDVGPLALPVAMGGARVDATDVDGFDITGSNNLAAAVLSTNASPGIAARGPTVFTVDVATGIVTPVGAISLPPGSAVNGFALPINAGVADLTTVATILVNGTALGQFPLGAPQNAVATLSITGLQMGETLIGIDFRPATGPGGTLYGVGTTGRIYTIDALGTATMVSMLSVPLDPAATNFGVDFNPVPNLLRIVTNTRQNLRVNVDTGVVSLGVGPGGADATLVRANPLPNQSFAAAYINNFGLPDPNRVTQLFVLDAAANSFELQNPPNNGVLVFRGRLTATPGINFTPIGEFDIAGGDNGLPLATLQPVGATQSNLYRVNLATGTVTQVGMMPIGPAGTLPLVGLTIVLR